eukprot:12040084-Alexandrium_andersonii.AAC.1
MRGVDVGVHDENLLAAGPGNATTDRHADEQGGERAEENGLLEFENELVRAVRPALLRLRDLHQLRAVRAGDRRKQRL